MDDIKPVNKKVLSELEIEMMADLYNRLVVQKLCYVTAVFYYITLMFLYCSSVFGMLHCCIVMLQSCFVMLC